MPDPKVRQMLERDVLPYLVTARRLRRQWFYVSHSIFGYTTDLVVALAAIGIASPLLELLGFVSRSTPDNGSGPGITHALTSVPSSLTYPVAVTIVAWVVLRVTFNREDGQKRAVLARSCRQVLLETQAKLPPALRVQEPIPTLNELLEKQIRPTVDRNILEKSWPWAPFAPGIDAEVKKEVDALCAKYENDWVPADPQGLRQLPARGIQP